MQTFNSFTDLAAANGTVAYGATSNAVAQSVVSASVFNSTATKNRTGTNNYESDYESDENWDESEPDGNFINADDNSEWGKVQWYENAKINALTDEHMPGSGMGDTLAANILVGFNKIAYRFYNDGDHICDGYEKYGDLIRRAEPNLGKYIDALKYEEKIAEYDKAIHALGDAIAAIPDEQWAEYAKPRNT